MVAGPDVAAEQMVGALQRELAAALAERDAAQREALEQQATTAEVLRAINLSQGNLKPVFALITEKAMTMCDADGADLLAIKDGVATALALANPTPAQVEFWSKPFDLRQGATQLESRPRTYHIVDLAESDLYRKRLPLPVMGVEDGGMRTLVHVPLLGEGGLIGQFALFRRTVRPFTAKQIALVESFAAQAALAIENARLLTEQREALEQQTATAEILGVISQSPTDIAPVMRAVAKAAVRFCGAEDAHVFLRDGNELVSSAHEGPLSSHPLGFRDALDAGNTARAHCVVAARVTHLPDTLAPEAETAYRSMRVNSIQHGFRAQLNAPLLQGDQAIGCICLRRREPGAFTQRQIQLLETFAAQAVIAIENVRLFTELRESLEQQTASAGVLQVISQSPTNVQPVFDAIAESALRLLNGWGVIVWRFENGRLQFGAARGGPPGSAEALPGMLNAVSIDDIFVGHALRSGIVHQIVDVESEPVDPALRDLARMRGWRSNLAVPMFREGQPVGVFTLSRVEPGAFSEREVRLLQTFAAQAVIAIENVRLFTELRESLEQQTATAEILRVISQSPTDVTPVLQAVARAALRFCGAEDALINLRDGDSWIAAAHEGSIAHRPGNRVPLNRESAAGQAILDGVTAHFPDVSALDPVEFATVHELAQRLGFRAVLATPLLREGVAIGAVVLRRVAPGPFMPHQFALLEGFAAQAVIAIENTRLFTELSESLEHQTATSEVLEAISRSTADLTPVLDTILAAATRLCGVRTGDISIRRDGALRYAASIGTSPEEDAWLRARTIEPSRATCAGRALLERQAVHVLDMSLDAELVVPSAAQAARSVLSVPLLREGEPIGVITLLRDKVEAFTERQIGLIRTFADQAVIAIENARLLEAIRSARDAAEAALERQTATADILKVIAGSPTDVEPVLKAVVGAARRFCGADDAMIVLREETDQLLATHEGSLQSLVGTRFPLDRSSATGRATIDGRTFHVPDVALLDPVDHAMTIELTRRTGVRALLAAPLLREGHAIGCVMLRKPMPGAFTPHQIELLETFAAQAVIAIENVRLFTELRDSLERLKAAQANLIQSEKMASLGQLTAGIAHEIKNPLNFVNNFASLSVELLHELKEIAGPALATFDGERRAELDETMALLTGNLSKITEHGKRADGIVKSMLSHSRGSSGDWQASDINALVDETLNLAYHGARAQDKEFNVTLERHLGKGGAPIEVVPQDITRVFLNLFGNGFYAASKRRATAGTAAFRPTLKVSSRDLGDAVEIKVRDNGIGIAPELRDKLFQPFFTTKPTGEGTGLGLSISYDIVTQQHGGTIEVESEFGEFTEFTVRLPRRRAASSKGA